MWKSKFKDLLFKKIEREHRVISLREVARETGLTFTTIEKLNGEAITGNMTLKTLEKVCEYFKLTKSTDLFTYVPGEHDEVFGIASSADDSQFDDQSHFQPD